jgi:hypothetical protein
MHTDYNIKLYDHILPVHAKPPGLLKQGIMGN